MHIVQHNRRSTDRQPVSQLPNTVRFQQRNWEILGVYYSKHGTPVEVQLRSLDERRELRIIAHALVATRCGEW